MKKKYGKLLALREYLLKGNRISNIEASLIFGVSNLYENIRNIKKDGFVIKSQQVPMERILKRINKKFVCESANNLPTKEILMIEYWISE